MQAKPALEQLVKARTDVVVNYIDINRQDAQANDWSSPVAQQYSVKFTPNYKIFDPSGNLIAEGQEASKKVREIISGKP